MKLCDGILHDPDVDSIDTESWDISSAFLQGLRYEDLAKQARELGYEIRAPREVFIEPPENYGDTFGR